MPSIIEITQDPNETLKNLDQLKKLIKFVKNPIIDVSAEPHQIEFESLSLEFPEAKFLTSCLGNIPPGWIWYPSWLVKTDYHSPMPAKIKLPKIKWQCWMRRPKEDRINLIKELKNQNLLGSGELVCPHHLYELERNVWWDSLKNLLGEWDSYSDHIKNSIDIVPGKNGALIPNYELRQDRALDLVSETYASNSDIIFISEKTWKAIRAGQLFLIWGHYGTVRELKKLGFKVFDEYIDHSYDLEKDPSSRLKKCVQELKRLMSQNQNFWELMWESTHQDRLYNQSHLRQDWKKYLSEKLSDN